MTKKLVLYILIITALICSGLFLVKAIKTSRTIQIIPAEKPLVNQQLVYIPTDKNDPEYGNPGADLVIVLFNDLGCPKCQKTQATIYKFVSEHPLEVKMVWKDAPSSGWFGSGSMAAHQAAYCAFKQNKFWEFVNQVALDRSNLKSYNFTKIAEGLKLNMPQWQACLDSTETKNKIEKSINLAEALGINELPGVFVNNKKIYIPDDINFEEMLNKFIAK